MLRRVIAVYRQFANLARKSTSGRRSFPLHVVALEERATPAAQCLLPAIQPSALVMIVSPPQAVASAAGAASSVRADLFGVGDVAKAEHANEWEELLAGDHVAAAPTPAHKMEAAETDTTGTVIVENEIFLPYVD